jgi:hypothetical protein
MDPLREPGRVTLPRDRRGMVSSHGIAVFVGAFSRLRAAPLLIALRLLHPIRLLCTLGAGHAGSVTLPIVADF